MRRVRPDAAGEEDHGAMSDKILADNLSVIIKIQTAEIERLKEENENYARIVEGLRRQAREATKDESFT